ncbi:M15 family metallopeptidase [Bailinhaonella thermotolerans]|uniref:M15 family peptidase n=1 Tax=Bailinhaonella thermotolerans TaxID=1070861 RepID=A0A3A4A5A0_9ACTN|nr:M15 family metallopeptidase [Bailinhaonella thermotolerans]RJL22110.1 M15 family peptidase [Bailinhaonella thermotolerans]
MNGQHKSKALAGVVAVLTLAGCGGGGGEQRPTSSATPSATPSPTAASPAPTKTAAPEFTAKISAVPRERVKHSWRPSCPVPLSRLRLITMTYWGFDNRPHTGEMVVNASAAEDIVSVFKKLYGFRYPIRRMELVDEYKASDHASIDADNTSAFNCRRATGSSNWSQHAYGLAVDLNPMENPYVSADGSYAHENAKRYVKRPKQPGVIHPGDRVVKAFASIGWGWGGSWPGTKDYQHFSSTGR